MTLEEAINHATEIAHTEKNCKCAEEHKQLAIWLTSLQAHKAKIDEIATDLQDISQYLKDEVHPRCEYDIYSRLEDLNGAVLQKLEELDK